MRLAGGRCCGLFVHSTNHVKGFRRGELNWGETPWLMQKFISALQMWFTRGYSEQEAGLSHVTLAPPEVCLGDCWKIPVFTLGVQAYLFQVRVTPCLPVSKNPGNDSPLSVVIYFLTRSSSLDAGHLTRGWIGDIDGHQLAARQPESRMPWCVIGDPQEKFTVVIIDLFCLRCSIKVNWKEVSAINLLPHKQEDKINHAVPIPAAFYSSASPLLFKHRLWRLILFVSKLI